MARGEKMQEMYKSIVLIKKGDIIHVQKVAKHADCSVPYASHVMKMARVEGMIKIDEEGNYIKSGKLPPMKEFRERVNAQIKHYRKEVGGTGKRASALTGPIEVNLQNIVLVVKKLVHERDLLIEENKGLKEKLNLLKDYIKTNIN